MHSRKNFHAKKSSSMLIHYAIYFNPKDYPGEYVVRRWRVGVDGTISPEAAPHARVKTLKEARARVPRETILLTRHPSDDPCIVETWL